jgi:nicotinate-nucleotide pyrophosphorylase (carboxylating)
MSTINFFADLSANVRAALAEDIGSGDITAALVPAEQHATATLLNREKAILCGRPWVDEVFSQVDSKITVEWLQEEGSLMKPDSRVFIARGPARSLLTAERCALNFLQLLSGVATTAHHYAELVKETSITLLDTRKTIPGLRLAQKYAVGIGGCDNHRIGLYDAFLIKENHINACGGISEALSTARRSNPDKLIEVEVETLFQLEEAIAAKADIIMLDNFSVQEIQVAITMNAGRAKLEASGGYNTDTMLEVARTGVDYLSIGALTKNLQATDFSLLFINN